MQVLSLLQALVPRRTVREWCLSGEPFGAAEAKEAGLLNDVVPAEALDAKTRWLTAHREGLARRRPALPARIARTGHLVEQLCEDGLLSGCER